MGKSPREEVLRRLVSFYAEKKISCDGFDCEYLLKCSSMANGRPLTKGAEAHLGTKYGEIYKILVLSLDTGGGSETIHDRTYKIEFEAHEKPNPHMKGTIELLRELFSDHGLDSVEVLKHFAMTNAAKCSAVDKSRNTLPSEIYDTCRPYHHEEIQILEPNIVFAEGKDSIPWGLHIEQENPDEIKMFCNNQTLDPALIKSITSILQKYIWKLTLNDHQVFLVTCPHPSSRGGQWQIFRDISLPIIVLYLKTKIDFTGSHPNLNHHDVS